MATIFTIGHSTRELNEFVAVLAAHQIQTLVDIRAFPMSRRLPHFNRETLEQALAKTRIDYRWLQQLGGRRKRPGQNSLHVGLRNDSFRNYADYMLTQEFSGGVEQLLEFAAPGPTAILCAERLYFRCHRRLVSDYLTAQGHQVLHIDDEKPPGAHQLMAEARQVQGQLHYIGDRLFS